MNEHLVYRSMADIMKRILQVQTSAGQLLTPMPQDELMELLRGIETDASWLQVKLSSKTTNEEQAAYASIKANDPLFRSHE